MDVANRGNARRLIGAAAGIGVALTWNRAAELINNFGSVVRALAHIRRRLAAERQYVQWQIRQGEEAARQREEARMEIVTEDRMNNMHNTNNQNPLRDDFGRAPVVALGDHALFTKSHKRVALRTGRKRKTPASKALPECVYRWQSIWPVNTDQGTTKDKRSLILQTVVFGNNTSNTLQGMALPMFAFDLTSAVVQGPYDANNNRTLGTKAAVPCFRLFKDTSNGALGATTAQYQWWPMKGRSNHPSTDASYYTYHREYSEGTFGQIDQYRTKYCAVDLLFKASRDMNCKIHIQTVRFKNNCGPQRRHAEYNVSGNEILQLSADPALTTAEQNLVDVFWESFWGSKAVHPLTLFSNQTHQKYIEVLSHEIIGVRPEDNVESTPFTHLKQIVYTDGVWRQLRSAAAQDTVSATNGPPVNATYTLDATRFDKASNYSVTNVTDQHDLYVASKNALDSTVYALVWMESYECPDALPNVSSATETFLTGKDKLIDPSGTSYNTLLNTGAINSCQFDVKVRKRVEYVTS